MASFQEKLRAAHDAFNSHDPEKAGALLPEGVSYTDHSTGQTVKGPEAFTRFQKRNMTMSSDMKIINARYSEGANVVVAEFTVAGTNDGPMGPYAATGKKFSFDGCDVYHLDENGDLLDAHGYSNSFGVVAQLIAG